MDTEKIKRIIDAAKKVFNWYYIFGEDNDAAKEHLAELGNSLQNAGYLYGKKND